MGFYPLLVTGATEFPCRGLHCLASIQYGNHQNFCPAAIACPSSLPTPPSARQRTKMASSTQPAQLPPASTRQSNFEQGVAYALHLWPALTLAVQNNWGGPDSADKRDWFAGAVVELFPEFTDAPPAGQAATKSSAADEPDMEDVETVLLQVMIDEFEVNVDDDSGAEIASHIIKARSQCAIGQFDEVNALRERFTNLKGKRVDQMFREAQDADQDTDWESDDSGDDDDVDMDDAPAVASAPKEKPEPQVDEDGFTMVTKKKR
ncbi:rRNA accumulation- protein [Purpureocillium takamizusanense]|uniref:rRNA accumulation- protein n=1 Tax=Purpureocillium takamizusanense TaxID=2060973 RepID=A0A9Q8QMT7_9HYPO|nr:rRNA accumulation- protein [Purpureocillium takamizusanense]UNI22568.1 rRNA accumulation- protein [Purpureocillium takamizusanense]